MYRFLRRPKWLLGHALVLVVVVAFPNLGLWQLRRLDEVRAHNARVEERLDAEPVPLDAALRAGPYTRVRTSGRYVEDAQLLTAPRPRGGNPGHHVLTPLETADGTVLVDRGWVPFDRDGAAVPAPDGEVEVSGLMMPAEEGDVGEAEHLRVIDPEEAGARMGLSLTDGYLRLEESRPEAADGPLPAGPPVLDEGDHLSYAVQWFLFTAVVLVGYPILIRRTARDQGGDGGSGDPAEPTPRVVTGT